jgi:aminoglycoside phosphotransferase (APT) family kinase protein
MVSPTPTAGPLTAATIGLVDRTSSTQSRRGVVSAPAADEPPSAKTAPMSAPAQNPRPAPVTTTAPTDGSASAASIASANSALMVGVQALSLSGRLSVRSVISPRCSWRIWVYAIAVNLCSWAMQNHESVAEALKALLNADVDGLHRLSGGASRETWAFSADGQELILRRDPPGRPGLPGSMRLEADAMRAAERAGLPVPRVLLDDDGTKLGTAGLVMARVPGETLARRILRDDEFAPARSVLTGDLARFLAGFHAIDPAEVPGAIEVDALAQYWAAYEMVEDRSATFEKTYDWLIANRPARTATTLVHGDLRMGNVIVGPDRLNAVIDWELVHLGDPLEDLAWLCVKAWRFGHALEVGGVGTIDELLTTYEQHGGHAVDRAAFHWWLVQKTLQWGIGCMGQAWAHLSGAVRSVELAAIGRRVAEQEWDLIEQLAPDEWAAAKAEPRAPDLPDTAGVHGRPTARELIDAVRGFLTDDVMPGTTGRLSFHARVAANALAIVERELAQSPSDHKGDDWPALARTVRDKLAVANPKHLDGRQ